MEGFEIFCHYPLVIKHGLLENMGHFVGDVPIQTPIEWDCSLPSLMKPEGTCCHQVGGWKTVELHGGLCPLKGEKRKPMAGMA